MCCAPQTGLHKDKAGKRVISVVFLVCFVIVSLLSEAFIITHSGHAHDNSDVGGTCSACVQLQNAQSTLKLLGRAIFSGLAVSAGLFACITIIKAVCSNIAVFTPVTSKIRMNN